METNYDSQKMVKDNLVLLGNEMIVFSRKAKTMFDLMADQCKFRKQTRHYKRGCKSGFPCTNPDLKDLNLGWACNMENCPYINEAGE